MSTLYELTRQQADLEALLTENGGEMTEELEQMWNETAETLPAKVDSYNAVLRNMQAQSDACAAEIKRLQALKKEQDNGIKRLKQHVAFCMEQFGFDKLTGGVCKFSLRRTTAIDVNEELALSPFTDIIEGARLRLPHYVKLTIAIDKTAVKEAMKDTDAMPVGCQRVENTNLIIK